MHSDCPGILDTLCQILKTSHSTEHYEAYKSDGLGQEKC